MGPLYRRDQKYWCKCYVNGRRVRESTGTTKEQEARRTLTSRSRGRHAAARAGHHEERGGALLLVTPELRAMLAARCSDSGDRCGGHARIQD
jgi:hypothetical protein